MSSPPRHGRGLGLGLVLALATLLAADRADGAPGPAPDPRRGERLDGREAPRDRRRAALAVPRALLYVPRTMAKIVLVPIERATHQIEDRKVIERLRLAFTTDDGLVGVRPEARWESDSRPSLGARFFDRRILGDDTLAQLRFRTAGPDLLFGELRLVPFGGVPLELVTAWDRDPSIRFVGLDGVTRDELAAEGRTSTRYAHDQGLAGIRWRPRLASSLALELAADVTRTNYDRADPNGSELPIELAFCARPGTAACMEVDEALVPAFHDGTRLVHAGAAVIADTRGVGAQRDRFGTGIAASLAGRLGEGIAGDPWRHASLVGDARFALNLGERQLTLRVVAGVIESLGDAPVPFDELLLPGGGDGLRGVSSHRLRGHSQLVGSIDYRWLLGPFLDASIFADYGGAFGERFDGLSTARMIPAVGVSIRYYTIDRFVYWRVLGKTGVQVAWAPGEGFRFWLSIGE